MKQFKVLGKAFQVGWNSWGRFFFFRAFTCGGWLRIGRLLIKWA